MRGFPTDYYGLINFTESQKIEREPSNFWDIHLWNTWHFIMEIIQKAFLYIITIEMYSSSS